MRAALTLTFFAGATARLPIISQRMDEVVGTLWDFVGFAGREM